MSVEWDDDVDEVLTGDAAIGFCYGTPAGGVVVVPMATLGLRDRAAGTVTVTTSLGLPKKLERLRRNPRVALSYHAREHGLSSLPLHVLVQGVAAVTPPDRAWLESITPQWETFLGPRHHGPLGRMMGTYYWERVAITVQVERVLVYDGNGAPPQVLGTPLPADPEPQAPPKLGTAPRVDVTKTARYVADLPHSLLAWTGGDGFPMAARVVRSGVSAEGVRLRTSDGPMPAGGRRAGLTSHMFRRYMVGQEQRVHTGWLTVEGGDALYAPHTAKGYALPPSSLLMAVGAAVGMRRGLREARKLGLTS